LKEALIKNRYASILFKPLISQVLFHIVLSLSQAQVPMASAVARDDAMIAAAKLGVESAEKKLIEEETLNSRYHMDKSTNVLLLFTWMFLHEN
jgi:hypothetical protein